MDTAALEAITDALRYDILRITHAAGSGHPTTSFSAVELATMLFFKYLRSDLSDPDNPANDRVIFSKGHASALLYSLYHLAGVVSEKELLTYRQTGSRLEGHPTRRFPYIEAATGSLGQGLAVGAGLAWAMRVRVTGVPGSRPRTTGSVRHAAYDAGVETPFLLPRVYVLMGDGELAEGSVWEAAAWAAHYKLHHLVAIVDVNRFGQAGETMYGHDTNGYRDRFESFGWGAIVVDGHDFGQLDAAFEKALVYKGGPVVIIARTLKGKGIPEWEDKDGWHNTLLPEDAYTRAVGQYRKTPVSIPVPVTLPEPHVATGDTEADGEERPDTSPEPYPSGVPVPTKLAFGNAVVRLGSGMSRLTVLDGDVANSLHTDRFRDAYPERFLECYIAEQTMAGVATGLARAGLLPVIATFSAFLTRAHDQFRMMPLSGATVIVEGAYAGVSVGHDGPSQFGLEDIAMFRSIAGSTVLYPADAYAAERLAEAAVQGSGVMYIRTTREPTPLVYAATDTFGIGGSRVWSVSRLKGGKRLKERVTIIAAGITLREALNAQKILATEGIGARVIDCFSIKPIDATTLRQAAGDTELMVVAEDHRPEGGLGEAVLSALEGSFPQQFLHLAVRGIPTSGAPADLMKSAGIDSGSIVSGVRAACSAPKRGR